MTETEQPDLMANLEKSLIARSVFPSALDDAAAACPPGTKALDTTWNTDDYTFRWSLISEYDPALAGGMPPVLRTDHSFSSTAHVTAAGIREVVERSVKKHLDEWETIHSPEYAAAVERARASQPPARVLVYGATPFVARRWCERNGINPNARTTYILTEARMTRGFNLTDADRVVFVGAVEGRREYQHVLMALLPCLHAVGGFAKIEHVNP